MYSNKELCEKWNNNIPLRELEAGYDLSTSDYDVHSICESFPFLPSGIATDGESDYFYSDITGIVVKVGDGDYEEVYVTESSRPYSLDAIYHPLDYYKE